MSCVRIAIIARHSLLADALVRRLESEAHRLAVRAFDAAEAETLGQLQDWRPDLILLDTNDRLAAHSLPILPLLQSLPGVHIVQMHPNADTVDVLTNSRVPARRLNDLLHLFQILNADLTAAVLER